MEVAMAKKQAVQHDNRADQIEAVPICLNIRKLSQSDNSIMKRS